MSKNRLNSNINTDKSGFKDFFSINDLREKDYKNVDLLPNERLAIKNYDRYRIVELNKQTSEGRFHNKYMQLQVMANLSPFEEFLKEDYFL
ncbi:MAG: hypothetical protein COA97_10510 [Flavobacteriales bacterium]|nr:MAG: hypothetical protein COA97_10510 [Flavobacteriales bacterium]